MNNPKKQYKYKWIEPYIGHPPRLELFAWGVKHYKRRKITNPPFIGENPLYTPGYLRFIELALYERPKLITDVIPDPTEPEVEVQESLNSLSKNLGSLGLATEPLIGSVFITRKPYSYRGKVDSRITFWNSDGFDNIRTTDAFFLQGRFLEAEDYDFDFITRNLGSFRFHLTRRFGIHDISTLFGDFLGTFISDSNLPKVYQERFRELFQKN